MSGDCPGHDDEPTPKTAHKPQTTDQSPELTLSQIFAALSNRRRRVLLECFRRTEESVERTDLVEYVVACESSSESREDHRERVAIDIHHTHLPKLSGMGLVEYDERSSTVRYYGHPLLESILEVTIDDDRDRDRDRDRD